MATITPSPTTPSHSLNGSLMLPQFKSHLDSTKSLAQLHQLHTLVIKSGNSQNPFFNFHLIRKSFTLNSPHYASLVKDSILDPNVFIYTAIIDGFVRNGFNFDGLRLYCEMMERNVRGDLCVMAVVIRACGDGNEVGMGKGIHGQVVKMGMGGERLVGLRLVELYGKCGEGRDARKVFDKMCERERDVVAVTVVIGALMTCGHVDEAFGVFREVREKDTVCWTAMIDGLIRNGEMGKALEVFREMQTENVRPNEVTVVCFLTACSSLGALELGRWVHSYVTMHGIRMNCIVGSALVNMYSRCGSIEEAEAVFEGLKERDVTAYNSMIGGLAMHGKSNEAVKLYERMLGEGIRPTEITFVGLLSACSHGGLVDLGYEYFTSMTRDYGIAQRIEHYGCMVDLLGRVGRLQDAYNFVQTMDVAPDQIIWSSLLSACRIHGNFEFGEKIAKQVLHRNELVDSGTYVLLSQAYSSSCKWYEAAQVRVKMKGDGIRKEPGCSLIEVDGEIHEFLLGDRWHPMKQEIYKKLEELNGLVMLEGYVPETKNVLQDVDDEARAHALSIHSERLAICYGLIRTEPGMTLRIVKNLRVCNDCHTMIKLVSKVTGRKIIMRDRKRFHHFENGACSCRDYW